MIDATRCPLCGNGNTCAMEAGASSVAQCWCVAINVPQALRDRVPEEQRNASCICKRCVIAYQQEQIAKGTWRALDE